EARVARGLEGPALPAARSGPAAPEMVMRHEPEEAAPAPSPIGADASAGDDPVHRKKRHKHHHHAHNHGHKNKTNDPITQVMSRHKVPHGMSQEEFLDICTERLLDLMKDEIRLDAERGETKAWSEFHTRS